MRIKDGNLVSAPCFVRHGKRSDTIGFEHSIADWYFLANLGEGWDWLFQYDKKAQNLYVATTDSMNCISDRYDIYHFNGTDFVYQKTGAPFWLHPQLHHYQRLELFSERKITLSASTIWTEKPCDTLPGKAHSRCQILPNWC